MKNIVLLLTKLITMIIVSYFFSASSFANKSTSTLIYVTPNQSIAQYDNLNKLQKEQWLSQHLALGNNADKKNYLLAAKHFYLTKKYKKANQHIDLLLAKLTDSSSTLLLANASYLKAIIVSIGLRQFESAIPLFKEAITTLKSVEHSENATLLSVISNYRLGSLYLFVEQPNNANESITTSIKLAKTLKDPTVVVIPMLELAKYYIAMNNQELAESQLIATYNIALETHSDQRPNLLLQLSRYYRKNERFNLAIDYAIQAVKFYKNTPNENNLLAGAYNNLAVTYEASGNLNTALVHYLNTIKLVEDNPQNYFLALATHNIGLIFKQKNKLDKALEYLKKANLYFTNIGHRYFLISNELGITDTLIELKRFDEAIEFAEKALKSAISLSKTEMQAEALEYLSNAYQKTQQFEKSNEAFNELILIKNQEIETLSLKSVSKKIESNNLDLHAKVSDAKNKINEQSLLITHKEQSLLIIEICLLLAIFSLGVVSYLLIKSKKKNSSLTSFINTNQTTQLSTLHDDNFLFKVVSNQLLKNKYIITIQLPILNSLLDFMGLEQSNKLSLSITKDIQLFLKEPLYQISEDTFIFSMTPNEETNIESFFSSLVSYYTSLIPEALLPLHNDNPILLGGMNPHPEQSLINLIQAKNIIDLSLAALSVVSANQSDTPTNNWLIFSEKGEQPTTLFTISTRKEWLKMAHNQMLESDTGLTKEISWLATPHF